MAGNSANKEAVRLIHSSYINSCDNQPFGYHDGRLFLRTNASGKIVFFTIPDMILQRQNANGAIQPANRSITSLPIEIVLMIADKCPRIDVVCLALASKSLARMLPLWKHNARPAHGVQITLGSRTDTAIMFRAKVFERLKCKHSAPSIRLCVGCGLLRTTDRNFWEGELHRMQSNAAACQLEYGMNIRVDEQRRDTEEVFEGALQKWHAGLEGALCPSCVAWTHHSVMRGRG